jgi:hypothetical protein
MKFKPSFQSAFPKSDYLTKTRPEPFLQLKNPSDIPTRPLEIPASTRFRHVYVAGSTQHGKSTLLEHMIVQDMRNGEGLTLLDPKGDLAESVVNHVPPNREKDCIYIDIKNPVPINFMTWETEEERQTLMADINQTFMRFSTMAAGDQWGSILRWTIYTLVSARKVCFLDLYYFFTHETRHDEILSLVREENRQGIYDDILRYWSHEFPKIGKPREGPILTRMSTFTTSPPLKTLLGTPDAGLDIFKCMEERKILLVNLMGVGSSNGSDVGALLTSKIQQAAFRRHSQPREERTPHFFYADEFQNFQTSDFDKILSEAGGLKLSLTLANQGFYQLETKIKQSVFANVTAARIAFHLSHEDVPNWRHMLPTNPNEDPRRISIEPEELANLPPHYAFFKVGNQEGLITKTPAPLPYPNIDQRSIALRIKQKTLERNDTSAQSSPIRTGDNAPCNSGITNHTEGNGTRYTDPTPASSPPKADEHEGILPGDARRILLSQNERRGGPHPKARPKPKR